MAPNACRMQAKLHPRYEKGQGTVEFAVVTAAIVVVVVALGALWRLLQDGAFVAHAAASASHHVQGAFGAVADVFMF